MAYANSDATLISCNIKTLNYIDYFVTMAPIKRWDILHSK